MNFAPTDEEVMLRDMARKFATSLRNVTAASDNDDFERLGALGLMGALAPVDAGGSGISVAELAVAIEEIAAVDASTALLLAHHNAALLMLGAHAEVDELVAGKLALLVDEQHQVEAHHRDGRWTLHGAATLVPGAMHASAVYVVARTPQGPALFFCDHPPERAAVSTHGLGACGFGDVRFAAVAASQVRDPAAFEMDVQRGRAAGEALVAACATGLARGSLFDALNYANEREQFGKPLAAFQAIQFKLADMATAVDGARLLVQAAAAGDSAASHHARRHASAQALFVCDEAVQIHGGYGYTREYAVEGRLRDARYFLTLEASA